MVIKGASRRNIGFWSKHLTDTKANDRAELIDKRGVASEDLRGMMREMLENSALTRAKNFMYVASFSPVEGEILTEAQWDRALEIFEKERGIPEGQPRIVYEHEKKGRVHRHVIWDRTDQEQQRVFADSLDWKICATASLHISQELDLTHSPGILFREPGTPRPERNPQTWEMFRGMKSELDPREIKAEVTALYKESKDGPDFAAKLEAQGYTLCQGDRRDFVILDSVGDTHSLARRLQGVKAKQLEKFMEGVNREALPSVEQGRLQVMQHAEQVKQLGADYMRGEEQRRAAERLQEIENEQKAEAARQAAWEAQLRKAAIEKEKKERQFVEPEPQKQPRPNPGQAKRQAGPPAAAKTGQQEKEQPPPAAPPPPFIEAATRQQFLAQQEKEEREQVTAFAVENNEPAPAAKGVTARIGHVAQFSENTRALLTALDQHGICLARVSNDEAEQSQQTASHARATGNIAPVYREGEIVAVTLRGTVHRITERTTGQPAEQLEKHFSALEYEPLKGLTETRAGMLDRAEKLGKEITAERMERATQWRDGTSLLAWEEAKLPIAPIQKGISFASKIATKALDAIAGVVEGLMSFFLFDGPKTKEQIAIGHADRERRAHVAEKAHTADQTERGTALYASEHERITHRLEELRALDEQRRKDHQRHRGDDHDRDR